MPLKSGYSRETVSANIRELRRGGYSPEIASAIALRNARAAWRRSHPYGALPRQLRAGRAKSNPIDQAERLFTAFMRRAPVRLSRVKLPKPPKAGVAIGKVRTIIYESDRAGKLHDYRHDFSEGSRPLFIASSDGKQLILFGGTYRFSKRGIVDKSR